MTGGAGAGRAVRTYDASEWTADRLALSKAGRTVSMCIPCRNEAASVGEIVAAARQALVDDVPVLDELIVLDDRSTDRTAAVAAAAGATVVPIGEIHDRYGQIPGSASTQPGRHDEPDGKGEALWASLAASGGDIVVWCDGDVTSFSPDWVVRLVAPLLVDDDLALVKASYARPTDAGGGGRTTELVARPLLSLLAPELAGLAQPLSGEFAGRRSMLAQIPFVQGWGVEIAMLLDLAARFGPGSLGQVELGDRRHSHQPLHALAVQAAEVLATVIDRTRAARLPPAPVLTRPDGSQLWLRLGERPPLAEASRR